MQSYRLFNEPGFTRNHSCDNKLSNFPKELGVHSNEMIHTLLWIGPRDIDSLRVVSAQLDNLV